jgi:ribosome-binding factor A
MSGNEQDIKSNLNILNKAGGFLRRELGRSLRIRTIPELHFHYDESIAKGAHLSSLIEQAVAEDMAKKHED